SWRAISRWNVCARLRRARSALSSGTLKQIECSDDAWLMRETDMPSWCTAAKVRAAMPGTPSIPLPVTVRSAWWGMAERAVTGYWSSVRRREISVPREPGSANGRRSEERRVGKEGRGGGVGGGEKKYVRRGGWCE